MRSKLFSLQKMKCTRIEVTSKSQEIWKLFCEDFRDFTWNCNLYERVRNLQNELYGYHEIATKDAEGALEGSFFACARILENFKAHIFLRERAKFSIQRFGDAEAITTIKDWMDIAYASIMDDEERALISDVRENNE